MEIAGIAAPLRGCFQHQRLNSQLPQAKRASQPTYPAADDHCFVYVAHNL